MRSKGAIEVSIVVPLFNEARNIVPLYEQLTQVLQALRKSYEIVFVNDGSKDRTQEELDAVFDADGARIAEIPIKNPPRQNGGSNYGLSRIFRVFFDLISTKFLLDYSTRPLQFFGPLGLLSSGTGASLAAFLLFKKLVLHREIMAQNGPLLFAVTLLILTGVQLLCLGLASEILSRTYYESQNKPIYAILDMRNHPPLELVTAGGRAPQRTEQLLHTYDLAAFNLQD